MLDWFNSLDTARRLFVIGILAFYAVFIYMYLDDMKLFFELYLFNPEAFNFRMQELELASNTADLGLSIKPLLSDAIFAFKFLGISILAVFTISYAVFRKSK